MHRSEQSKTAKRVAYAEISLETAVLTLKQYLDTTSNYSNTSYSTRNSQIEQDGVNFVNILNEKYSCNRVVVLLSEFLQFSYTCSVILNLANERRPT